MIRGDPATDGQRPWSANCNNNNDNVNILTYRRNEGQSTWQNLHVRRTIIYQVQHHIKQWTMKVNISKNNLVSEGLRSFQPFSLVKIMLEKYICILVLLMINGMWLFSNRTHVFITQVFWWLNVNVRQYVSIRLQFTTDTMPTMLNWVAHHHIVLR